MRNDKKQWHARVLLTVHTTSEGQFVNIPPGEYTLSEGEGARYQLIRREDTPVCLSLWYADLQLCAYMGQLEIHGMWP